MKLCVMEGGEEGKHEGERRGRCMDEGEAEGMTDKEGGNVKRE